MRIRRTLPPSAAPMGWSDLGHALAAVARPGPDRSLREDELREFLGVGSVFLVSSGKAALSLLLRSLRMLSPGKRAVLLPAYTCWSVPSAVVKAGCEVRLCDVDPATLDYDRRSLAGAVTSDLLCVVVQHLFGRPAALDDVLDACRRKGVWVIEDAAQAMGASGRSGKLGTIADAGFFSLGRGKNVTCGNGGVIVTGNGEIARVLGEQYALLPDTPRWRQLFQWAGCALMAAFIDPRLYWIPAGLPFLGLGETRFIADYPVTRLSSMHAALLRGWRRNLARGNDARGANTDYYRSRLPGAGAGDEGAPLLRFPILLAGEAQRDRVLAHSRKLGLGISGMYPASVDRIPEMQPRPPGEECPQARQVAARLVTLPTHHLVQARDRERIASLLCS